MDKLCRIAAYARISVDDELDKDNVSIENQKSIIGRYVEDNFPTHTIDYYEDRDMSGYTFEQRESYQRLRAALLARKYDVLIVKDLSRFSRRLTKGLGELEDLIEHGIRFIAVTDNVDIKSQQDYNMLLQIRFMLNESAVTETSKKVRDVIRSRQSTGEWLCNVPYAYYLHPTQKGVICVDEEGANVVRRIFELYNSGNGYKKIAHCLTDEGCPTARMLMKKQLESKGADTSKLKVSTVWSHISVAKIVSNDFYVGTLRQHMWQRAGINKKDVRVNEKDHIVFENHHEPIIGREVFDFAREQAGRRGVAHYKGIRKYDNPYSGFIFCEDCNSPMFATSNAKRPAGYVCGAYHRRGLRGCTSHHVHESTLDEAIRHYIITVKNTLVGKLAELDMVKTKEQAEANRQAADKLYARVAEIKQELQTSLSQRIKQIAKNPDNESAIEETFDSLDTELRNELKQVESQIAYLSDEAKKKSEIKENINHVLSMFRALLDKEKFAKEDIALIVDKITVDEDKVITVQLKASIDEVVMLMNS